MSEYWKSTPKYWCKHCKTFVRDSKLERTNHEATPKHQGNIKRFLRDLHRGHEREERDQQRAKDEVSRLNEVISGSTPTSSGNSAPPWQRKSAIPPIPSAARQATPAERKAQLSQLAAMGVAVPEDFRREMAMAGDWQTMSERPVYENVKKEEDRKDTKPFTTGDKPQGLNIGVRKRKYEGQEEEDEARDRVVRKGWGSTTRTYPGAGADVDLDTLLNGTISKQEPLASKDKTVSQPSEQPAEVGQLHSTTKEETASSVPSIKKEDSINAIPITAPHQDDSETPSTKQDDEPAVGIVFKKRKPKQIRQS